MWIARVPWDDTVFVGLIEEAARRVGKNRTQVLIEAGYGKSALNQKPSQHGRGILMIERLMIPLGWTPDDALAVVAKSFGWATAQKMEYYPAERRTPLQSIIDAALKLRNTLKSHEASVSLETALALVGELVRGRGSQEEGNTSKG